jgi:2-polyprenyl-6-methoxyphenol hydroxylase-like FAD-dependent oxidoreductase
VAVAGAGLSGLCLAQRLRQVGIDVHVYESDPGPFVRPQGYRITVDGDGIIALRDSLPDELFQLALATGGTPGGFFRFTNARLRDAFKLTFKATPDGGRQMDRQVLRAILLAGLEGRVHYGKAASSVERDGSDGLVLRFADGTAVRASVVVGADGIGSTLREQITPGAEPTDTGMAGIYGRTPLLHNEQSVIPDALNKSGVLAIGDEPGRAFFFTTMRFGEAPHAAFARLVPGHPAPPAGDDYVMWGLVINHNEIPTDASSADSSSLRSLATRMASGFHPLIGRLISTADDDATMLSTFAVGRRPTQWPLAEATMMGDAVHAMPPFGAHGGNTALRDAALLGSKLAHAHTGGGIAESAIAAYQKEMLPYAFKAVDAAAGQMRRLTDTSWFQRWLMLRVLPRMHRITVPET